MFLHSPPRDEDFIEPVYISDTEMMLGDTFYRLDPVTDNWVLCSSGSNNISLGELYLKTITEYRLVDAPYMPIHKESISVKQKKEPGSLCKKCLGIVQGTSLIDKCYCGE